MSWYLLLWSLVNQFLSAPCEFFELIMHKNVPALKMFEHFCPDILQTQNHVYHVLNFLASCSPRWCVLRRAVWPWYPLLEVICCRDRVFQCPPHPRRCLWRLWSSRKPWSWVDRCGTFFTVSSFRRGRWKLRHLLYFKWRGWWGWGSVLGFVTLQEFGWLAQNTWSNGIAIAA